MCHAAVNWVINEVAKRDDLKPAEKWFLIVLADHADRDAWSFIHGHATLAKDAGMSKRTVVTMLARFEELRILRRSSRFRYDGTRTTDLASILGNANPALGAIQSAENDADHVQIATPEGAKFAQHKEGTKPGNITKGANAPVAGGDEVRQAFDLYNRIAEQIGSSKAMALNDDRKRRLKARLKDCGGIDGWTAQMDRITSSSFLTGQTHHHFSLTLDFLLQPSSFTKLVEGQYHDANRSQTDGRSSTTSTDFAADRAAARLQAMVDGARQASASRRSRWGI